MGAAKRSDKRNESSTKRLPGRSPNAGRNSGNRAMIVSPIVIVAAGVAVYANSLAATFVFDDRPHIYANERIKTVFPLGETLSGRRPLVDLTLAMNYAVGRFEPAGYHAFNGVVHVLAALTLFAMVRRILTHRDPKPPSLWSEPTAPAAIITVLWIVHPLQTQSVTYVIQRGESMLGLFYLLTLYCAIRGMSDSARPLPWFAASIATCALGMATKAVAITAPAAVFLYDWLIVTRSPALTLRRRWPLYLGLISTTLVLVACGVAQGVLASEPRADVNVGFAVDDVSPMAYLMAQPGVLLHYLRLSVWPHPLCIDYGWPLASGWAEIVIPSAVVAALVAASVWAAWRHPRAGFAGLAFFLVLLPTSSVIPIRDPLFEHRMYLPLAAVIALAVTGGVRLARRAAARFQLSVRTMQTATLVPAGIIALALGVATVRRNFDYHSEVRLWQSATEARPQCTRAHYSLAVALGRAQRHDESLAEFRKVLEVGGDRTRADVLAQTHYHIGWVLIRNEQTEQAVEAFEHALEHDPDHVEATFELGFGLAILRDYDRADALFRRTLELDPNHAGAKDALARLAGRPERP